MCTTSGRPRPANDVAAVVFSPRGSLSRNNAAASSPEDETTDPSVQVPPSARCLAANLQRDDFKQALNLTSLEG